MKMMAVCLLTASLTLPAAADVWVDSLEFEPDQVPLVWTVVPDGSGPAAAEARRPDGSLWGRSFRVRPWFRVWQGPPEPITIEGLPAEDIWLETADGGLAQCPGGTCPDGPSDADGWITWTEPLHAGGGSPSEVATVLLVMADPAPDPVPLAFRSPDQSGDLVVDLTDIVLFTPILYGAEPLWQGDFNHDGVVNLSDVVVFTNALAAGCP